jgi:hypothetical protein
LHHKTNSDFQVRGTDTLHVGLNRGELS